MHETAGPNGDETADALDVYRSCSPAVDDSADEIDFTTILFTARNPEETVSAVALMSGRIIRIELGPQVVAMSEAELCAEIAAVAELARLQALAAQHVIIAELMQRRGQDRAATRSFLYRELNLPTPEAVEDRRAALFA